MSRGRFTVFVTTPKFLFPLPVAASNWHVPKSEMVQVPFGGPNWGWLNRLKNSVRNSILNLSVIAVLLNTAKSKLTTPCWRSVASTRGSFPKPYAGGAAKRLVLNQPDILETALPEVDFLQPLT